MSPFIDYMLDSLESTMINSILAEKELTENEKKLLERMKKTGENAEITVKKGVTVLKMSTSTVRNTLNSLAN